MCIATETQKCEFELPSHHAEFVAVDNCLYQEGNLCVVFQAADDCVAVANSLNQHHIA